MILVDTAIWIDHLRRNEARLVELVIGELACGNLKNRETVLRLMRDLPCSPIVSDQEALFFIDPHRLMGKGASVISMPISWRRPLWRERRECGRGTSVSPPLSKR